MVEDAKAAERVGDIRKLYSALKKIGIKDSTTIEEEYFKPGEFREHFQKVSDQRFEREIHEIKETAKLTTQRWDKNSIQAAKVLGREITWPEFNNEVESINDSAPGIENVRMIAVKRGGIHLRQALFRSIMKIVKTQSEDWPERIKEGWVIPLHKKSAKNDLNNYRGVCLLPFASRIIARILASRLREWSEKIEVLGENQSGFRQNRSTVDATQINIRVDEETRRVLGYELKSTRDRPGAVLLDITVRGYNCQRNCQRLIY